MSGLATIDIKTVSKKGEGRPVLKPNGLLMNKVISVYAGFRIGRQTVALFILKHSPAWLLIGRIITSMV